MKSNGPIRLSLPLLGMAIVVALCLAYVGAYYALVRPGGVAMVFNGPTIRTPKYVLFGREQTFRVHRFFSPMHRLDRQWRPKRWILD